MIANCDEGLLRSTEEATIRSRAYIKAIGLCAHSSASYREASLPLYLMPVYSLTYLSLMCFYYQCGGLHNFTNDFQHGDSDYM